MNTSPSSGRLLTFEFLSLCLIIVMAFSNVCVFYSFYYYLGVINIPVVWRGFLVGLEPMASFVLRLFVLPWLHLHNAYTIMVTALVLLIAVSCSYLWVTTVAGLIVLRILHGAVFVFLTSAAVALAVHFIPVEKSGQGFSILTVCSLIPFAVVPPATEALLPYVRTAADVYAGVSVFSLIGIALLIAMRGRIAQLLGQMDAALMKRLRLSEMRGNFRQRPVILLLSAVLFMYLSHATFFYFLKNLSLQTGTGHVGSFFIVSVASMIVVRLFGMVVFDRFDKIKLLLVVLSILAFCLPMLPGIRDLTSYYALAVTYGGCFGLVLPALNALLFVASAPQFRALNSNMTLLAIDAGYFLTPYLGGTLIALGANFSLPFYVASGFMLMCLALVASLGYNQFRGNHHASRS